MLSLLPLHTLSLLPHPLPANQKETQHGPHTPEHLPPYQGEKQVTGTGSVDMGTEGGLEPQNPGSSCFGCVTLGMALPLSAPQFSHL